MSRGGRLGATLLISASLSLAWGPVALADHCEPIDNPDPLPGQNTTYCHTPKPTEAPDTPKPTAKPTTAPATAAPRTAAPVAPVRTSSGISTPEPTPFDIEVPEEPLATTSVEFDPIDDTTGLEAEGAEEAGTVSSWIFGFFVGLLVGALFGRMSWGIRRRRRQQIFG